MKNLSDRLRELRGNLKQAEFCERIGMNVKAYSHYETGRNLPTIEIIAAICKATGASSDYLLGLNTPGDSPPKALAEPSPPYNAAHEPCPNCAAKDLTIAHLAATLEHLTKAHK